MGALAHESTFGQSHKELRESIGSLPLSWALLQAELLCTNAVCALGHVGSKFSHVMNPSPSHVMQGALSVAVTPAHSSGAHTASYVQVNFATNGVSIPRPPAL